jgi:hypothetical protein
MQTYGKSAPRVGSVKGESKRGLIGSRVGPMQTPKGKTLVKEHYRTKPKGK